MLSAKVWSYLCTVIELLDSGTAIVEGLQGDKRDRVLSAEAWSYLSTVKELLDSGTTIAEGLQGDKRDRVLSAQKKLQDRLKGYTKVEPGGRYTTNGTLSLVRTAYVIYDDGKLITHNCWTGPTAGSDYEYPVTVYF